MIGIKKVEHPFQSLFGGLFSHYQKTAVAKKDLVSIVVTHLIHCLTDRSSLRLIDKRLGFRGFLPRLCLWRKLQHGQ